MKRLYLFAIAAIYMGAMAVSNAWPAAITVNIAQKTAISDTNDLSIKPLRIEDSQIGLLVNSNILDPQDFMLKTPGLKEKYDIYVCGSYFGQRSAKQFADGVVFSIPGRVVHPDLMRCLNALKDKIKPEVDRLSKISGSEPMRVVWTLRQANDWVKSGIRSDESYRSLDIIINPSGHMLKKMPWRTRLDAEGTVKAISNSCWYLQKARARMYEVIKDPDLRNSAVVAMTPVTLTTNYVESKRQIVVKVVNDCNLPISGTITYAVPKGWKTDAKSPKFENLGAGKTYQAAIKLIAPSKDAQVASGIRIAANVTVTQDKYTAKVKLINSLDSTIK
ncbi:MAG: NEW3 domain-containing protein [Armatimonadota bacterium]